jgi:hypothetical protein
MIYIRLQGITSYQSNDFQFEEKQEYLRFQISVLQEFAQNFPWKRECKMIVKGKGISQGVRDLKF